jgi:hypothetical protein
MRGVDLTVDLRDAVGDRLMLTGGLHRDGVCRYYRIWSRSSPFFRRFLILAKQRRSGMVPSCALRSSSRSCFLRAHSQALSVRQAVSQSRKSRGFFSFFRRKDPEFKPTLKHEASGDACRIYGTLFVKRVTGLLFPVLLS